MFHKRLLSEFKSNQKYVAGMILMQWIALLANMCLVYFGAEYLNLIYQGQLTGADTRHYIEGLAVVLVVRACANHWNSRWSFAASNEVKRTLRERICDKTMELGMSYRGQVSTAEIVQVSTEGVEQLEIYFGKYVPQFFYSLLAPLTLFVVVSRMNVLVAIVLLLCVPLIPISIIAVQKFAKKMLNKYWGTYTELGDSFLENLQGLTTMKIYEADERYAKKMDEEAEKFRKVTMRVLIMQLNSISIMDLVAYGGAAIGIILSVLQLQAGHINLVQGIFIILISAEFFLPLRLLGSFFHIAMNGNAAANKIFHILDLPVETIDKPEQMQGCEITFDNVSFSYQEAQQHKEVLSQISFAVKERQFTALVGESGCGKSTIASLLMGQQSAGTGEITIGGAKLDHILREQLYQKITRINHDSYLFKGSVAENLRMGNPNASEQEMLHALEKVDLLATIQEKGGLQMQLSEKAGNLSGGQKQRMALARAILHDSDIYLFDEATSNIDAESENRIMEVIHELARSKTVILISHRLANVVEADEILVLKNGQIVEQGRQEELLGQKGYYETLYRSQQQLEQYAQEV